MRLCGLLLIVTLVLSDVVFPFDNLWACFQNLDCYSDDEIADIISGMTFDEYTTNYLSDYNKSDTFESDCDFSCKIYKSDQLNCSWSTHSLPKDAQYSVYVHSCSQNVSRVTRIQCSSNSEKERVECYGQIFKSTYVVVQVNASRNIFQTNSSILCNTFVYENIEILEPPKIIMAVIKSSNLEIEWMPPKADKSHCFEYELKINNNTDRLNIHSTYTKPNIDLTRSYSVQIRTKWNICASNDNWSDWSEILVVGLDKEPYQLNAYVIASIAFVLPMILLSFLLLCKFQRVSEKLFPSIPSPSVKIKMLLEKDDFTQVMPPKQDGFEAEEGAEILQVTS